MIHRILVRFLGLAWFAGSLLAQEVAGTWQGSIETPASNMQIAIRITRGAGEQLSAQIVDASSGRPGPPLSSLTVQGPIVKFVADAIGASFEGTLSKDGNTIAETLTRISGSGSLTLVRAVPKN